MKIVCAWGISPECPGDMGEKPPYEDTRITHSICAACKEMVMADEVTKETLNIDMPESIKEEWLAGHDNPEELPKTEKVQRLSNQDGRKALVIQWPDEHVMVIATNNQGEPFVSETSKPDTTAFYLACAFLMGQGLESTPPEESPDTEKGLWERGIII